MDTNAKSNMLNLEKEEAMQSSYFALNDACSEKRV